MASPLVIAHRGASAVKPENTLAAFQHALDLGVAGIELDVQTTADGVAVVYHDFNLRRLTGTAGFLRSKTREMLRPLRVKGSAESIPPLRDVLKLVAERATVQIELKRGVDLAPVVKAIIAARATRWVILASFELPLLVAARELAPRIPRMLITEGKGGPKKLLRQLASIDGAGLSVNHAIIHDRGFVETVHASGATLWTWTVNDAARMRALAVLGVDAILSDNPDLLRKTLSAFAKREGQLPELPFVS